MSLIDDAVACGAWVLEAGGQYTTMEGGALLTPGDLARLRAMWLEEFRERAAQLCNSDLCACCWSEESQTIGELHAAAIRALPLDKEAT